MEWFAARLLHIILIDDKKPRRRNDYDETVIVFRARSYPLAFKRALALGRAAETEYRNERGQRVRWAFVEVTTLDQVGKGVESREVSSRLHARTETKPVPFGRRFHPERSQPQNSGI